MTDKLKALMEMNGIDSLKSTVPTNAELEKENEELREQNKMLIECILEISEIVYA